MKLSDLIARLRLDIGDIDKDRYSDAHIVDMINEASCEIFDVRPDLFQKRVVVKLDVGDFQKPCCVDRIIDIEAVTDANGIVKKTLRVVDSSAQDAFGKENCGLVGDGLPSEVSLDSEASNSFSVSPQVLPNQEVFVRILGAVRPQSMPFDDLTAKVDSPVCDKYSALLHFVKYLMLSTETESVTSASKAQAFRSAFYDALGLKKRVKDSYVFKGSLDK
jgi:hypothetical protein